MRTFISAHNYLAIHIFQYTVSSLIIWCEAKKKEKIPPLPRSTSHASLPISAMV